MALSAPERVRNVPFGSFSMLALELGTSAPRLETDVRIPHLITKVPSSAPPENPSISGRAVPPELGSEHFVGYVDGHTSDERPGISEKSSVTLLWRASQHLPALGTEFLRRE